MRMKYMPPIKSKREDQRRIGCDTSFEVTICLRSRSDARFRFVIFVRCSKKTLVQKRREDGDHGNDDKRGNPIKLFKLRKIVKEEFYKGGTEQSQAGIPHRRSAFAHTDDEEQQREQRPRHAVAHVAREIS